MKKILILAGIIFGGLMPASAQTPGGTPTPAEATKTVINTQRVNDGIFDTQRRTNAPIDRTQGVLIASRNPAFRKPTKEDLRLIAPDAAIREKYADFLRQPDTGLIRLLSDAGCQESASIIVATEFCIKYKNLFGGSSYSFRNETYTLGRFSDVVYKTGVLYSYGKMTLGFITDLGEGVSPAGVSAKTSGAKYVFDFAPPETLAQIEAASAKFQKGVVADGFSYRKFHALQENHTYLIRSIAYRRRERVERNKVVYDELTHDNRKDVIVVFQVVRLSGEDGVTLLWKQLQRKDVAKIDVSKF